MQRTPIRWATYTWNPTTGCTKISPGCLNCYAEITAENKRGTRAFPVGFDPTFHPERLPQPALQKRPGVVFVDSMSDLFHDEFTYNEIASAINVMAEVARHQYVVLTKRPDRMRDVVRQWLKDTSLVVVPSNIWLGVSVESDDYCSRVDVLRQVPVSVKVVSAEPLIGPLASLDLSGIAWLIAGGESAVDRRRRAMEEAWALDLRDRALATHTAFFWKQHAHRYPDRGQLLAGQRWEAWPTPAAWRAA
jgi:protein gp37